MVIDYLIASIFVMVLLALILNYIKAFTHSISESNTNKVLNLLERIGKDIHTIKGTVSTVSEDLLRHKEEKECHKDYCQEEN